ncbi:MAG: four helix bundle protein [Planctomycetaceae bacterium]|nr:four helix bundle protein [Planctomycetaceae bacterium]
MASSQESDSVLLNKGYAFAIRVVNMTRYLITEQKEYILAKQVLRSGTAIGALVTESKRAESKPDFIHKLSIALKEADETLYWITLLKDTEVIDEKMYASMSKDTNELIAMLVASIKTAKNNLQKAKSAECQVQGVESKV